MGLIGTTLLAALVIGGLIVVMSRPENRTGNLAWYSMIFIVLVVLVFAVLMLEGPIIGGPFSTINNSLCGRNALCPTPTPTALPWWQFWGH